MGRLFGTDGVRGIANADLTPELAFSLGKAGAYVLGRTNKDKPVIIIGADTRLSGYMLENGWTRRPGRIQRLGWSPWSRTEGVRRRP